MIARWLLVSCALSGVSIAACAADTGGVVGGAGSTGTSVGAGTGGSNGNAVTTGGGPPLREAADRARTRARWTGGLAAIFRSLAEPGGLHRRAAVVERSAQAAVAAVPWRACSGAALCDSFERTMLGPDWTLDNSTASTVIEVVTNKGHTGTNSVHISFGTTTLQSYISESKSFPAMGGVLLGAGLDFFERAFGWSPDLHRSTRRGWLGPHGCPLRKHLRYEGQPRAQPRIERRLEELHRQDADGDMVLLRVAGHRHRRDGNLHILGRWDGDRPAKRSDSGFDETAHRDPALCRGDRGRDVDRRRGDG